MNQPSEPAGNSGKVVIGIIVAIATTLAAFGWWWKLREAAPARDRWGSEHVLRIRDAAQVQVLQLAPQEDLPALPGKGIPAESLLLDGAWYMVEKRVDASRVLGVNDFRRVLLADFGYDWKADLSSCSPRWQYAVRWTSRDGSQTTLLYAGDDSEFGECRQMFLLETGARAAVKPMSSFAESFFTRALEIPAKKETKEGGK